MRPKKQAGARKEGFFGPKIGNKLKCKGKKLSNFQKKKKKKTFWAKKKQAGAELEKKKRSF